MTGTPAAWVFPGHGSQYAGMGRETLRVSASAREVFAQAEALTGLPVRQVMLRGPGERLTRPALLEAALAALSLSHALILEEAGLVPDRVAGYSAGEVAALYAAGVVRRDDALRLATMRGEILERAAAGPPARMAALYGIPAGYVAEIVWALQGSGTIAVAGWNAADHATVVGCPAVVVEAERRARALGAQVSTVEVAGAWHCGAVADAAEEAWARSREVEFRSPRVPFYTGATGGAETDPERIRLSVARQICEPVLWHLVVEQMVRGGCLRFLELGPGGVLSGFLKRRRDAPALEVRCVERRGGALSSGERRRGSASPLWVRAVEGGGGAGAALLRVEELAASGQPREVLMAVPAPIQT